VHHKVRELYRNLKAALGVGLKISFGQGSLSMNIPTATALFIIALIVALAIFSGHRRFSAASAPWPFYVKRLLTRPEQVLYHRLVKALPDHIILSQIQVSRVLGVQKSSRFHEWNNRINRMSYDFVICDKAATVIGAIELDDKSHESNRRRDTDAKKSKATTDAGLKLVRWHVKSLPDEQTIQRELSAIDSVGVPPSIYVERRE
jgi:very-short-patch-repair endonuclease